MINIENKEADIGISILRLFKKAFTKSANMVNAL